MRALRRRAASSARDVFLRLRVEALRGLRRPRERAAEIVELRRHGVVAVGAADDEVGLAMRGRAARRQDALHPRELEGRSLLLECLHHVRLEARLEVGIRGGGRRARDGSGDDQDEENAAHAGMLALEWFYVPLTSAWLRLNP